MDSTKKIVQIVGGDFNAELGPGYGVERVSVGPHTLKEGNKRRDWMKQWLIQNFTALNTMCRKTFEKQVTNRSSKETEKQLDYILVDRKHMYRSRDAEANDMIHMGDDQRSVVAKFVVRTPKKEVSQKSMKQRHLMKQKEKSSMKPKLPPPHRKELLMLESQHYLAGTKTQMQQHTNRMSTQTPQPLSLNTWKRQTCCGSRSNFEATEFEHTDGKLVENDTATCHSNDDTNAAAATCNDFDE